MPTATTLLDSSTLQVLGGIAGALLGALAGAFGTYVIGEKARKKQKDDDEIKEQRLKIRANERALKNAEAEIEAHLVLILKNIEHYNDIKKGIVDLSGKFRTTLSMPQPYFHQVGIGVDLMNVSFATKWQSYESEVVLQNSNLNEFNEYYVALRSSAHESLLHGQQLNSQVLAMDDLVIKDGAGQCIIAAESFKERCFTLVAEIALGAQHWESIDFTKVTLEEVKIYINKIHSYEPTQEQLTSYIDEELRPIYTPEKAFKSASQKMSK